MCVVDGGGGGGGGFCSVYNGSLQVVWRSGVLFAAIVFSSLRLGRRCRERCMRIYFLEGV